MVVTKVSFFSIVHDGSIVVFTGAEPPYPLCRVDAHGMAMTTLVARNGLGPTVMPDGRSVLYSPIGPGVYSVPIDGGAPRKVTDQVAAWGQSVSADGRRILFANGKPRVVVVCDLPGCANAREVEIQGSVDTAIWTPDGKGIASVFASNGERNIWVHPLDGSPEYAWIRHEPPGRIQHFSWSADGTRLVMSRGQWTDDIVLIKGLR
jgi:Tol biopolymer transport system component